MPRKIWSKPTQHGVPMPRKRRVYRMPPAMRQRRDRFRRVRTDVMLWLLAIGVFLWAIWMWLSVLDPTNYIVKTAIQRTQDFFGGARGVHCRSY
jgi:hypothetical protein